MNITEKLQIAYDKVKEWPENRMSEGAVLELGEGFTDLLALRNLVPDAVAALEAAAPVNEDGITQIAMHLDCELDADSILHTIREIQADLEIAKDAAPASAEPVKGIDDHEKPRYTTRRLRHEIDRAGQAKWQEAVSTIEKKIEEARSFGVDQRELVAMGWCLDAIRALSEMWPPRPTPANEARP